MNHKEIITSFKFRLVKERPQFNIFILAHNLAKRLIDNTNELDYEELTRLHIQTSILEIMLRKLSIWSSRI
ncbi:hypothetical protein BpHYR1_007526 [Brachionus plicatilis]|uniref:Four helix bundle protein n=1 Tax=Brachionus plicatilis TaxID=10195 RepID=A0A3M7PTA9_BRAPC|nr:hypothetical protein BpHYR1_007526 [Brachionus plicatilis]